MKIILYVIDCLAIMVSVIGIFRTGDALWGCLLTWQVRSLLQGEMIRIQKEINEFLNDIIEFQEKE